MRVHTRISPVRSESNQCDALTQTADKKKLPDTIWPAGTPFRREGGQDTWHVGWHFKSSGLWHGSYDPGMPTTLAELLALRNPVPTPAYRKPEAGAA